MQLVSVSQSVSGTVSLCSGWVKGSSRGPGWGAGAEGRGRSRQPWRRPSPWEVPLPVQGWSAGCHCTQAMHTYRAALTTHAHIQGCTHYPCNMRLCTTCNNTQVVAQAMHIIMQGCIGYQRKMLWYTTCPFKPCTHTLPHWLLMQRAAIPVIRLL